eukprot:TRINITY_DN5746_c0_g1_i1.p1 TRINITY_DN5746_c0_g1~~TRINITY_DN5746_c0_g1_i1.p1  ORF type:complete len:305 (+),score=67.06 TRINITY_DN5746_c0_g1_i1:154-1068(+)
MAVRNLASLDKCRSLISKTKLFVFDCDGVIWRGSTLIDGVKEALEGLLARDKTIAFVTNNSTKSRSKFVDKFHKLGLNFVKEGQIWSSAYAAACYLRDTARLPKDRKVYVVGQQGLKEEIEAMGYAVVGGPEHAETRLNKIPDVFDIDRSVGAVVVGFDRDINYYKLTYATMCAREIEDCHFIATNRDAITHLNNEQEFPGGGTMVAALAVSIGREPQVAGKPSPFLVHAVRQSVGLDESAAAVMVGDRLDTDIVFGNTTGMTTVLVLSGVTKMTQVTNELSAESQPDEVMTSLADWAEAMKEG